MINIKIAFWVVEENIDPNRAVKENNNNSIGPIRDSRKREDEDTSQTTGI